jgi:hypothetical protein
MVDEPPRADYRPIMAAIDAYRQHRMQRCANRLSRAPRLAIR